MINFVLEEFGQTATCIDLFCQSVFIKVGDFDGDVALNSHQQIWEGEAVIPQLHQLFALSSNMWVYQWCRSKRPIAHIDKYNSPIDPDLGRSNTPTKTMAEPEIGQGLTKVLD